MPAFIVTTGTIKNLEKFKEYTQKTCATYSAYEGKVILRGRHEQALAVASNNMHQTLGIVSFPSIDVLNKWFQSDDYQSLIPLRDEAADISINSYVVPA